MMSELSLNPFYESRYLFDFANRRVQGVEHLLEAIEGQLGYPAVRIIGGYEHIDSPANLHEWVKFFLVPSSIRLPGYALNTSFGSIFSLLARWSPTWRTFGLLAHADLRLEGESVQSSADTILQALCDGFNDGWIVLSESCLPESIAPELIGRTYIDLFDFKSESSEILAGVPTRFSRMYMNDELSCELEPMAKFYETAALQRPLAFLEQFLFTISEPGAQSTEGASSRINHLRGAAFDYCQAVANAIGSVLAIAPESIIEALPRYAGFLPTDGRLWLTGLRVALEDTTALNSPLSGGSSSE